MTKKKISIADMGNIRKPERLEPDAKAPVEPPQSSRGRPAERVPYVQLNSRISLQTSQMLDELRQQHGISMREVIELAIENLYKK